jgi:hypothetical protein
LYFFSAEHNLVDMMLFKTFTLKEKEPSPIGAQYVAIRA